MILEILVIRLARFSLVSFGLRWFLWMIWITKERSRARFCGPDLVFVVDRSSPMILSFVQWRLFSIDQ